MIEDGARPEQRTVAKASASLMPMLGVQPLLGRWLLPDRTSPFREPERMREYTLETDGPRDTGHGCGLCAGTTAVVLRQAAAASGGHHQAQARLVVGQKRFDGGEEG